MRDSPGYDVQGLCGHDAEKIHSYHTCTLKHPKQFEGLAALPNGALHGEYADFTDIDAKGITGADEVGGISSMDK